MEVTIDEKGDYKPANYEAKVKKVTDHNTVLMKVKIEKLPKKKRKSYINTKCVRGRERFCQVISLREEDIDNIYTNMSTDVSMEFRKLGKIWDQMIMKSFEEIKPRKNMRPGIDSDVRILMKEERRIRDTVKENPERGRLIYEVRKKIHKT